MAARLLGHVLHQVVVVRRVVVEEEQPPRVGREATLRRVDHRRVAPALLRRARRCPSYSSGVYCASSTSASAPSMSAPRPASAASRAPAPRRCSRRSACRRPRRGSRCSPAGAAASIGVTVNGPTSMRLAVQRRAERPSSSASRTAAPGSWAAPSAAPARDCSACSPSAPGPVERQLRAPGGTPARRRGSPARGPSAGARRAGWPSAAARAASAPRPGARRPVPASRISRWPWLVTSTQEVLPPMRATCAPEVATLPRTPQKRTSICASPCERRREVQQCLRQG